MLYCVATRNIPRLARVTAGRWRGDIGSSLDAGQNHHHQMDRNTDTSVDVTWIFTEKAPKRAFSFYKHFQFKTLLRCYAMVLIVS